MKKLIIMIILKVIAAILIVAIIAATIYAQLQTPRLDRERHDDQARTPIVSINRTIVSIQNIRNASYRTTEDYDVSRYDDTFDLTQLDELWFAVEPFSSVRGPAHTLLSFGFGGRYISISVETRKQLGEDYDPVYGLLNGYELIYVIATEQDVIGLRANHRHDDVYLYPIRTTPEKMQALFVDMITRADSLGRTPEFYHTVFDNCTSSIRRHINKLREDKIPFSSSLILPYYSDRVAYMRGLIDTDLPFDQARDYYHINDVANQCPEDEEFGQCIRQKSNNRNIIRYGSNTQLIPNVQSL